MKELHHQEHNELKRLFGELRLDRIDDRLEVADHFLATEEHLTAAELTEIIRADGHDFGERFVRGTLELLGRLGFAYKKEFADREPVFEHRHLDDHHDHFICTNCGRITEFYHPEMERLQRAIAREHGFKLLDHRHQLYGLCADCRAERKPGVSLAACSPGERLRVVECVGGRRSLSRLADMGLTPGAELEVLTNSGGPVVVACGGARLALGRNMAAKLTCQPVESETRNGPAKNSAKKND